MRYLFFFIILIISLCCTKFGKNVTVKGRVMNQITGEGISDIRVFVYKATSTSLPADYKTVKEVHTDSDGSFELNKLGLSKYYVKCDVPGDYYLIGWEQKDGISLFDKYTLSVKKGKVMHADYYAVPYGEIKISIHNVNCQGPNDTLIYKRNYVSLNGISVFQPFTLTGCYDNNGAFAKVPSGDYSVEWTVIRNGISNSYSHILTVPANGQGAYNIDY